MEDVVRKLNLWHIWLTVAMAVVGTGVMVIFAKSLPPQVPLLYSRPWGEEQLVVSMWLWGLPIFCGLVGGGTAGISKIVGFEKMLEAMMIITSIVVQMVVILGLLRIVFLII